MNTLRTLALERLILVKHLKYLNDDIITGSLVNHLCVFF